MRVRVLSLLALFGAAYIHALPLTHLRYEHSGVEKEVSQDFGFDYMHLVQEWPGSFCDEKRGCVWPKSPPEQGGWTLHGLWPEFLNGSWPQFCDASSPFNASAVNDLLPQLHEYWPSLVSPNQASFWKHEWEKHGTCMESLIHREHTYFSLVLFLRTHFDAAAILADAGITPSAPNASTATTTSWRAAKRALDAGFGQPVEVACSRDRSGKLQLAEVRSCYAPVSGRSREEAGPQLEGIGVRKLACPKEMEVTTCEGPDTPILYPTFHPAP